MMDFIQACELGRESVNSVNANVLANVLRELVSRYQQSRRSRLQLCDVQVRCADNLDIRKRKPRKIGEDEGFESDEDARSTASSCCLVEDHVFKGKRVSDAIDRASPSANSASTDSANSSGSSDTDDVETPSPVERSTFESFPISDVIFCHTEPRHQNTIAWVVKRKTPYFDTTSRLGKTGVENIAVNQNCLDVIVIKCRSSEDFKKLCDSYRELSRRIKLDQYKFINRRKPIVLSTLTDTKDVKVSLSDMKVARSNLLKASELSILNPKIISSFKNDMKNSVSLNSLFKPEAIVAEPKLSQFKEDSMKKSNSLSNIAPSRFNLLQRTDLDGMTHIEVSKTLHKSKIQKEIEGVILTDVESCVRRDQVRQRQSPSVLSESRLWRPDDSTDSPTPPQRPERRKYTRKKIVAPNPPPPQTNNILPSISDSKSKSTFYLPIHDEKGANNSHYIRLQSWSDKEKNLGSWKPKESERLSRKSEDNTVDRRRARSVGRTSRKTPMAYRYIDITDPPAGPAALMTMDHTDASRRRRNSFDDVIQQKSNLKPVIKNNKKTYKYSEPKKVTFSAFATVQVVD